MVTMLDGKWLTLEETAKLTGYTDGYLRRMLRNGELSGKKFSARLWLVDLSSAKKLADKPHTTGRPRAKTPQNIGFSAKSKKS
jgi:excisionase family DNA binding protein